MSTCSEGGSTLSKVVEASSTPWAQPAEPSAQPAAPSAQPAAPSAKRAAPSAKRPAPSAKLAQVERAFDRFHKGPGSRGTGLGLTIARSLIAAHGGTIHLASEPGQGTTVTFTLRGQDGRDGQDEQDGQESQDGPARPE